MKCSFRPGLRMAPCAVLLLLLLTACFSAAPAAPSVRWFDPTPRELPPPPPGLPPLRLRVQAPPQLGRELAYRVADREFAFDADHRWIGEPSALLHAALARGLDAGSSGIEVTVELERFEFDLVGEPRARVQFALRTALPGQRERRIESVQSSASRSVDALVTAMALALVDATAQVQRAVAEKP